MRTSHTAAALIALAALASASVAQTASYPFHDSFEGGVLDPVWGLYHNGDALQEVTDQYEPWSGSGHLHLGGTMPSGYVATGVDLTIDLKDRKGVLLDFMMKRSSLGVYLDEGLYLTTGNLSPQLAWKPDPLGVTTEYTRHVLDLDELAADLGLEFTEDFQIRYVWAGYDADPEDGIFLDDFRVTPTGFSNLATVTSPSATGLGEFGRSAVGVGDLTGDGVVDLAVGHPGYSLKRGRVELFDGSTMTHFGSVQKGIFGERMGEAMARLGDLDGDGFGELLVGAPSNDVKAIDGGAVYVVSPKLETILATHHGTSAGGALGAAVASAGDLDGDGLDEYLAAAPTAEGVAGEGAGQVTLYRGSDHSVWRVFEGGVPVEGLGASLSAGPDLDGDGLGELLLGAPGWIDGQGLRVGRVVALSGADGSLVASFPGLEEDGEAGSAVTGLGDLDGDGVGDLALGAPGGAGGRGTARVLSGVTGVELASFAGELQEDRLGASLCLAGDMDGFGLEDLAIGAGTSGVGSVTVVRLPDLVVLRRASVVDGDTGFGSTLAPLGDVNGDGFADLLVGEPRADELAQQDSGQLRVISTVTPPELDRVVGLHCTLSGEVRLEGSNLNPALEVLVDGLPVPFVASSPVELVLPMGPELPGGFHDLTLVSDVGTLEVPSGLARYPALEVEPVVGLGDTVTVRVENGSAGAYVLAFSGAAYPDPAPFEAWGWFHGLELNGVWIVAIGAFGPGDTERFHSLTAPSDSLFVGQAFHVQAWTSQADLGLAGFSNLASILVEP